MGIFDVFTKKKESLTLPPPPMPEMDEHEMELPSPPEDFAPISAPETLQEHEMEIEEEPHEPIEAPESPEPVRAHIPRDGPIFVSVQDYQAILNGVTAMKSKLSASEESFRKLHEIKTAQEKQLEGWRTSLEDVQKKLTYVDEVLFGR